MKITGTKPRAPNKNSRTYTFYSSESFFFCVFTSWFCLRDTETAVFNKTCLWFLVIELWIGLWSLNTHHAEVYLRLGSTTTTAATKNNPRWILAFLAEPFLLCSRIKRKRNQTEPRTKSAHSGGRGARRCTPRTSCPGVCSRMHVSDWALMLWSVRRSRRGGWWWWRGRAGVVLAAWRGGRCQKASLDWWTVSLEVYRT